MLASRALRQYDAENGRGVLGDVALTLVMVAAVIVPMSALSLALPHLIPIAYPERFLLVLLPLLLSAERGMRHAFRLRCIVNY